MCTVGRISISLLTDSQNPLQSKYKRHQDLLNPSASASVTPDCQGEMVNLTLVHVKHNMMNSHKVAQH